MVTVYVEAILGLLLLFAWVQNTAIHAVAWWGFAHLIRAASIVLFGMYGTAPDLVTIDLANALLFTAFAVTWTGARVFDGRPAEPVYLVTGAVLWLLVCRLPVLADATELRSMFASGIVTTYTWLTAYEFWRGRSEPLVSRWPAIFMLFAHGALFLLRTPLAATLPWSPGDHMLGSVWLTVLRSKRCCSRSRSPSSCWRWRKSARNCATAPPPWSIRSPVSRTAARSCKTPQARQAASLQSASDRRAADRSRSLQVD